MLVDRSSLLVLALTSLKTLVLRMMRAVMVTRCSTTFILEEPWGVSEFNPFSLAINKKTDVKIKLVDMLGQFFLSLQPPALSAH